MKKVFRCQLLGGFGNQIFQYVILNWIQQKFNKEIIVSKFDYSFIKNKYRNIKGVQSTYFFTRWIDNHIVHNDPMLLNTILCKLERINSHEKKFITDDLFLLGLKKGKDFLLEKLSLAKFMRAHCVFPQVINYPEFEEAWLNIMHKLQYEESRSKEDLIKQDYDITIHLRRGDYLNFPNLFYELKEQYFNNAIDILKQNLKIYGKPKCLIIGNDFEWAKEKFSDSIKATYQYKSEFIDFSAIANSKNIILSNSSFSISAARLAMSKKIAQNIICPCRHYVGDSDIGPISHQSWIHLD